MAGEVEGRLAQLGLQVPEPVAPVAAYVPFVQTGTLVFVSGQLPVGPDGLAKGHLTSADHVEGAPSETSAVGVAQAAARLCGLNLLAQVKAAAGGLDQVLVVKLTGFVNCDGTFQQHPIVINGASELMAAAFGEAGQHSRSAVGASSLPLGAVLEVEGIFEIG